MSCSLNSFNRDYLGDSIGDYYSGDYKGYEEFRL